MAAIAPEQAPAEVTGELKHLKLGLMVARDRIELPTRGFSAQSPKTSNLLNRKRIWQAECPNIFRSYGEIRT